MDAKALLAWNLRFLRTGRNLSQERLAADAGVDRAYVSEIERSTAAVSLDVMSRLATALGVEVGALLAERPDGAEEPRNLPKGRRRT